MKRDLVIYTEKINCQDCYKCIKVCPVKSIKVEDFSASVINDTCIYCGQCINACPAGDKKNQRGAGLGQGLAQSWL
jgi:Dissimilatory sulfite reductase (desulfoviridin), alpha and beta subunits